jgi:uroporphyrin-3 C-methyltransferase
VAPGPQTLVAAPAPRSSAGPIAWLALLLALIVGAFGVWSLTEAQRREAELLQRVQALESSSGQDTTTFDQMRDNLTRQIELELEGLQARQQRASEDLERAVARVERLSTEAAEGARRDLARQLDALQRSQAEQGERFAALSERLAEQSQLISDLSVEDRESWQIAEVQYLLRLANQRLIMTGDTLSAEALLRSADAILRDLDGPELMALRGAVAGDLAAVRAVPRLDSQGLYLRLDALIRQTDDLVLFELPERESPEPMEASDDWRERLAQGYEVAIDKLSEYIVVSRRDVPIETLMDPQYEGLVRQNMRMLLEQAQVAMLSGNQMLYEQSLERARGWVTQFFKDDQAAATAMAEELRALADERVAVNLPDLNASLSALDGVLRQRLSRSGG